MMPILRIVPAANPNNWKAVASSIRCNEMSTVAARSIWQAANGIFNTTGSIIRSYQQQHLRTVSTLMDNAVQLSNTSSLKTRSQLSHSYPIIFGATAPSLLLNQQHRSFAAKAANQPAKKDDTATLSYWEQKKAAKDRRRELFISRQERKQRLKVRRAGKPKDTKKIEFQAFYIEKKVRDEFLDRKSRQAKLAWKIRVAVLIERLNVILPDKEKWEIEYEELKMHLNRYGKQYPKEFVGADFDYDHERPMTYEDLIASLPFKPAPRETEADASGDVRTTDRKLKTSIYLTVQEQNNGLWQFPTVDIKGDETLLDAAKRAIPEQVGADIEFWCPSNCPWSVHLTPYTEDEQKQHQLYGTKTFFMKLQYDEGKVELDSKLKNIHDFAWLDRHEMVDRVKEQQGDHMSKFYYYML